MEFTDINVGTLLNQREEEILSRTALCLRSIIKFSVDTAIMKVMNEPQSHCTVH